MSISIKTDLLKIPLILLFFTLLTAIDANAKKWSKAEPEPDTVAVLSLDELYKQILENHPVAKQAQLLSENAKQQLRLSRGYFDPKIKSTYDTKEFHETEYYSLWKTELKIPVWLGGIDLKAGYEKNTGYYLNPEHNTDDGRGLPYAGISVPIGKGLFIDERRASVRQAAIFEDISEAEKVKMLNKLILQVAKDYWNWYFYYHQYETLERGFEIAEYFFKSVKIRVEQGDMAPIDSVEAKITMQQRQMDLNNANVQLKNARLMLSNHIWGPDSEPLELSESINPVNLPWEYDDPQTLQELMDFAMENHPELLKIRFKNEQLLVDRRLAREMLKPELNLNYNFLKDTESKFDYSYLSENYKLGISFEMPIFLRKERAKVQQVNIKIDQNQLESKQKEREIINELNAKYNELVNLNEQLDLQEDMVDNYVKMVRGERQKFRVGESSVFYVNVRENKLIEAEVKLFKMRYEFAKSIAELRWAAGQGI
ncbi:MAG: transporter [Thalassobius sp.]|nr:transporter [Thalassovita sp.]